MSKGIVQLLITFIIAGLILYITFDFLDSSKKERLQKEEINSYVYDENGDLLKDENNIPIKYGAFKGDMMYDYELKDISTGKVVKISDFRGKKVFLNFWASWCPPCKDEAPHLQSFHEEQNDVVVLGVNVKDAEREKDAEFDFIDKYGITFQNTYAPEELYYTFPINSFPTSILINSEGIIEEGVIGPLDLETLISKFNKIK